MVWKPICTRAFCGNSVPTKVNSIQVFVFNYDDDTSSNCSEKMLEQVLRNLEADAKSILSFKDGSRAVVV